MASGLGVLLSTVGTYCDLIYTDFRNGDVGYDSTLVKNIYSVTNLPQLKAAKNIVREWDIKTCKEDLLIENIIEN